MKKLMTLAMFLVWSNCQASDRIDLLHHAVYSSAIYGVSALITNAGEHENPDLLFPLALTLFIGLAKESTDPVFDPLDLVADTVGATSAMGLFALTW